MDEGKRVFSASADDIMPVVIEMLSLGKDFVLPVKGGSMLPFLVSDRDKVIIHAPEKILKKGDVVLYRRGNGKYVLHRIVRIDEHGDFEIVGDAQLASDYPVKHEQIIAVVKTAVRKGEEIEADSFKWKIFAGIFMKKAPKKIYLKSVYKRGRKS